MLTITNDAKQSAQSAAAAVVAAAVEGAHHCSTATPSNVCRYKPNDQPAYANANAAITHTPRLHIQAHAHTEYARA